MTGAESNRDETPQLDALSTHPPVFGESRHTVLSPSGEFESNGDFARGLGARRMKIVIFAAGGVALLLAALRALQ